MQRERGSSGASGAPSSGSACPFRLYSDALQRRHVLRHQQLAAAAHRHCSAALGPLTASHSDTCNVLRCMDGFERGLGCAQLPRAVTVAAAAAAAAAAAMQCRTRSASSSSSSSSC